eukprot:g67370.t1
MVFPETKPEHKHSWSPVSDKKAATKESSGSSDEDCPKDSLFDMFFEGPEKLLEILWLPEEGSTSLRTLPQSVWESVLKLVRCAILSKTSNDFFDAYVLSESSLFVYPNKIILKTCGTTTLLRALDCIIKIAKEKCGLTLIDDLWYSRRNFFEPKKQLEPHGSWKQEVSFLDSFVRGSSYILGSTNDMHWYVYVTDFHAPHSADEAHSLEPHTPEESTSFAVPPLTKAPSLTLIDAPRTRPKQGTCTLEVLMHDLEESVIHKFYNPEPENPKAWPALTKAVTKESGVEQLIPGSVIDDYLFSPCGYSMNGLKGESYWTIHVTPQPSCSFASFETDYVNCDMAEMLKRVLAVFKPKLLSVSFIAHVKKQSASPRSTARSLMRTRSGTRAEPPANLGLKIVNALHTHDVCYFAYSLIRCCLCGSQTHIKHNDHRSYAYTTKHTAHGLLK